MNRERTHGDPVTQRQRNALSFAAYPYMPGDRPRLRPFDTKVRQGIFACQEISIGLDGVRTPPESRTSAVAGMLTLRADSMLQRSIALCERRSFFRSALGA